MIVKDEEEYLPGALASANDVVDEIIVVDTGSKDRSVEIAKRYGAYVHHYTWKNDFSAARNYALRQASGDWILVLDADQELDALSKDKIRRLLVDCSVEGYYFKRKNYLDGGEVIVDRHMALFKNRPNYRFIGVWGEKVFPLEHEYHAAEEVAEVIIQQNGNLRDQILQRNVDVIRQYQQENATDPSCSYWLGLQFFREGWYKEACGLLEVAVSSSDLRFPYYSHALYLLGQCYLMTQQVEMCKSVLEQAIELFPDFTDLYYMKGIVYMYEEEWEDAANIFLECCAMPSPSLSYLSQEELNTSHCYLAAAICFQRLGQMEKMLEFLLYVQKKKFQNGSKFEN